MQVTLDIPDKMLSQVIAMSNSSNSSINSVLNSAINQGLNSRQSRSEAIKQGIAKSGYVPKGKRPNMQLHANILELVQHHTYAEVASILGCGIATVYRVRKRYLQN